MNRYLEKVAREHSGVLIFEKPKSIAADVQDLIHESTTDKYLGDIATKKNLKDLVVFRYGGKAAGFAIPRKDSDGHFRTGPIFVSPSHRGLGISKRFVSEYFQSKKGRSWISEDNHSSKALFSSAGFKKTGKSLDDDGETLFEYKKES